MTDDSRPDTRRALLDHARTGFASSGFDGASVRAITQAADANLGAITYHFGGKEQLYLEVLREVVEPLAARVRRVVAAPGSHLDRAAGIVEEFFEHFKAFPEMPRLMLQQIATGRPPPGPVLETMGTTLGALAGLIRAGQQAGEIRAGDPLLMALSVISQPVYLNLVTPLMPHVAKRTLSSPDERQSLIRHAVAFARAALTADPTHPRSPQG